MKNTVTTVVVFSLTVFFFGCSEPHDFGYRVLSNRTLAQFRDALFYIKALGDRCLDFGGQAYWAIGAPVYTYRCNGTVAQQVRVKELDAGYDVELRVPNMSLCIGVRGGAVTPGAALEVQFCNQTPAQRFAVDGDAIMMGIQSAGNVTREYVIEPDESRTPSTPSSSTPARSSQYFRFYAVDGTDLTPTTGFVRVTTETKAGLGAHARVGHGRGDCDAGVKGRCTRREGGAGRHDDPRLPQVHRQRAGDPHLRYR